MILNYTTSIWRFVLSMFLAWAMVIITLPAGGAGIFIQQFGAASDLPVPSAFVP